MVAPVLAGVPQILATVSDVLQPITAATCVLCVAAILTEVAAVFPAVTPVLMPVAPVFCAIANVLEPVAARRLGRRGWTHEHGQRHQQRGCTDRDRAAFHDVSSVRCVDLFDRLPPLEV
jgi:hypothetical protein